MELLTVNINMPALHYGKAKFENHAHIIVYRGELGLKRPHRIEISRRDCLYGTASRQSHSNCADTGLCRYQRSQNPPRPFIHLDTISLNLNCQMAIF